MRQLFLIFMISLFPSIGMAQENVTDKPTEPAEWIMVTNSLVKGGYTISFSPIPMTEAACVNAAEFAKYMIKSRYTACLNIITGDYLNNYLDNDQK